MANFENIYAMLKYQGKGSQTVFKCHGSLESAPSSSAVFLIPSNHGRGQNITLQSPVGITNFHSNSLHSSLATLKCFGQSSSNFLFKEKAVVKVYHNHSGVRSVSWALVGITILDSNSIIQITQATSGTPKCF